MSSGTDRGKSGVKRSMLTEGHGVPIGVTIEGSQRHDMKLVRPTIESIIIDRPAPTEEQPQGMCLDKGYDYQEVRDILHDFSFTAHIRTCGEEAKAIKMEVTISINHCSNFQRITNRASTNLPHSA